MKKLFLFASALPLVGSSFLAPTQVLAAENKKKVTSAKTESKFESKYDSILVKAVTDEGMFPVHRVENDYYFEIPDSMMNRDFMIVNKLSQVSFPYNDAGVNKGMNYENLVIQFEVNKDLEKVFVMNYKPIVEVPEDDNIALSVADNYRKSILEFFEIAAYKADSSAVLVKVNKVYDGKNKSFNNVFGMTGVGGSASTDHSYIKQMKSFPENIVAKSVQTTNIPGAETEAKLTVEVTSNLVLLPEVPMTPRFDDARVGYFTNTRLYFNDDQHEVDRRQLLNRWRLEPKDPAAYLRGELVEPIKPIVFYVDPATPEQWKKHIIKGVFEWQVAFEQAGFKNAIVCKEVDPEDKDFDLDDVRYSVITYAASEKANAMGPSVIDPRSGEVIEADVVWWHNVMTAVQSWMRVQTGIIDPKSRANKFEDEHMGDAIRFVSSHEVGHTLGLKHNMGSSFRYPVDSLRSASFTEKYATASSIMDYARFNYVAQPEDNVTAITPEIGSYDKFAIEFGYRWFPENDPFKELPKTNELIAQAYQNPHNIYNEQQSMRDAVDPRALSEDLGDNSVTASLYGLENLKRIMPLIVDWTTQVGQDYTYAGKLANDVIGQWYVYGYHVLANIGGVYMNNVVYGDSIKAYEYVSKERQEQAVDYILTQFLDYPEWLFDSEVYDYIYPIKMAPDHYREYNPFVSYENAVSYLLWDMITNERLTRMVAAEAKVGDEAYTTKDLFDSLNESIFKLTRKGKSLTIHERLVQKIYVDALIIAGDRSAAAKEKKNLKSLNQDPVFEVKHNHIGCGCALHNHEKNINSHKIFTGSSRTSDVISLKRAELLRIEDLLRSKRKSGDETTRAHYEDLILRIDQSLR